MTHAEGCIDACCSSPDPSSLSPNQSRLQQLSLRPSPSTTFSLSLPRTLSPSRLVFLLPLFLSSLSRLPFLVFFSLVHCVPCKFILACCCAAAECFRWPAPAAPPRTTCHRHVHTRSPMELSQSMDLAYGAPTPTQSRVLHSTRHGDFHDFFQGIFGPLFFEGICCLCVTAETSGGSATSASCSTMLSETCS